MNQKLPKILVVCGPTASGKTRLALDLAKKFDGEIVIADSRQAYQEMLIGTNSPTAEERAEVPHHLCNFLSPDENFNVAEYKKRAEKVIDEILSRKKLPILVGGTGLYIKAVVDNYDFAGAKPDPHLRKELEKKDIAVLLKELESLSDIQIADSERKNKRRVIRALEVAMSEKISPHAQSTPKYHALQVAVRIDREKLYEKINARVLEMIQQGLEKEVRNLVSKYSWNCASLSGIGYREFRPYFEGTTSLESVISEIQKDTRRYAKRQITWFKADQRIHWVKTTQEAGKLVQDFL